VGAGHDEPVEGWGVNIELFCHFDSQIDIRSLNFAMNVSCRK